MKRTLSILLTIALMISCFTISTLAYGKGNNYNGKKLTGIDRIMYDAVAEMAQNVALGNQSSTEVTVTLEDLGLDGRFYAKDLGLSSLLKADQSDFDLEKINPAVKKITNYHPVTVAQAAFRDFPFDFYWADSVYHYTLSDSAYSLQYDGVKGEYYLYFTNDFTFSFPVSAPFAANSDNPCYVFNTTKAASAQAATTKAMQIVNNAKSMTDYEKIQYYMQQIVALTDYNYDAATNDHYYDMANPWQVLWVFDNDSNTKVVCEGYSKAFQYLCDLTDFENKDIWCYSISGSFQSGTAYGGHMWNILHMDDGKNYLVDITNCDLGGSLYDSSLFLVPYLSGSVSSGYTFKDMYNDTYFYEYSDQATKLYTTSELTLSNKPYVPTRYKAIYDVNQDYTLDMKDVLALRKYIIGITTSNFNVENADVNKDDSIDMKDILFLRKYLAGLI